MTIKRVDRGKNHSYTIDGERVIGVTTALSKGVPKPALPYWAARTVAQQAVDMGAEEWAALRTLGRDAAVAALKSAPWQQRDAAAVRGTNVHAIADKLVHGQEVAVPEHLYGHVEAALAFMTEWKVRPVLTEKVVGSYRYGYAGTFDLVADVADGRRILFDYKTSSGIYPETAMQLCAYAMADYFVADDKTEIPMSEVGIQEIKAVHLRADGYDVRPLEFSERVFKCFLSGLHIARASEDMDGWVGEPAEVPMAVAA